ncbi:MAG TPA: PAS domain S-box protein [Anaerolineales bacterium]
MPKRNRSRLPVSDETVELKNRLEETEETLRAIRQYMVDAFVVTRSNGTQVVTLSDADFPYRTMVESMNEGAVTLIPDGTIFYCNPRFGEMVQMEGKKLIGVRFLDLIVPDEQETFTTMFKDAGRNSIRQEFNLQAASGKHVPVQLSVYQLSKEGVSGISIIATDISERIQAEEKIRSLASKLTMAEQRERHRISQILHDDLQQRLFAIKAQLYFLNDPDAKSQMLPAAYMNLDEIQNALSEAIAITRNLSIDISPIILHGEGVAGAMTWLSSRMQEQHGLQVELDVKESFHNLDDHMRVLLFQAVRELLFNVVKHAEISKATIRLEQSNGCGRITVADSGKGFEAEATMNDPQAAHGLLTIQDRLGLIGGSMGVTSKPGAGTQVVIEFPLEKTSA